MRLGRVAPPDWNHVEKFPLTAAMPSAATPVVFGINWYSNFDHPVMKDGRWWIGLGGLGVVRGGHAICSLPVGVSDQVAWRAFYNQGNTGECEGFSHARAMSLLNRVRYDAPDLYFRAQDLDGVPRDPQAGTYNRVVLEVLRLQGPKTPKGAHPVAAAGIAAYRWATSAQQVLDALEHVGPPGTSRPYTARGAIPLLNSWGTAYPRVVWMPLATVDRMLSEDGEAGVITDK